MAAVDSTMSFTAFESSPLFQEYLGLISSGGKDLQAADIPPIGPEDALLVIDMQNDFVPMDPDHNPEGGAFGVAEGHKCIDPILRMIHQASSVGATVVATRDYHPADHVSFNTQDGPFPPHCVQGTKGSELLAPIAAALAKGMHANPAKVHVVFKAFHEDVDSFGGLPYKEGPVYPNGGDGRVANRSPGIKDQACCVGCTKTPWSGAMKLKMSGLSFAFSQGKVTAAAMNAPPDILAIAEEGAEKRGRNSLDKLLKDAGCKRLFVCGLAMDFCVFDTCINARALGFEEVYCVLDAGRAAHIEKVGSFGTGFLQPPAEFLPTLNKAGVKHTWTAKVCGEAAMVTPLEHLTGGDAWAMKASEGPQFPEALGPLGFNNLDLEAPSQTAKYTEADNKYTLDLATEADFKTLLKLGWGNEGRCSPKGPIPQGWAGAPKEATHLCWAYPLADSQPKGDSAKSMRAFLKASASAELSFAIRGGFLLLDAKGEVLLVQVVIAGSGMQFGAPQKLMRDTLKPLTAENRFQEVTLPFLRKHGAQEFCWINAGETLPGCPPSPMGGFAYLLDGQGVISFAVTGWSS